MTTGGRYHICNRGVDKRNIFEDRGDLERFLLALDILNGPQPIGSIFEYQLKKEKLEIPFNERLVKILAFGILPNHYHLLVEQQKEEGVIKFMHRLGTSHTKYFNNKYRRSGSLFQGNYKCRPVDDNEDLLNLSVYINYNPEIHHRANGSPFGSLASKCLISSLDYYLGKQDKGFVDPTLVLEQFISVEEYEKFAKEAMINIIDRKKLEKELEEDFGLEA